MSGGNTGVVFSWQEIEQLFSHIEFSLYTENIYIPVEYIQELIRNKRWGMVLAEIRECILEHTNQSWQT